MTEKAIQKQITNYLTKHKIWWVKFQAGMYTRSGVPDLLVCYRGLFVALEVKTPKGKVTEIQRLEMEKIRLSSGEAYVVRFPADVITLLAKIDSRLGGRMDDRMASGTISGSHCAQDLASKIGDIP